MRHHACAIGIVTILATTAGCAPPRSTYNPFPGSSQTFRATTRTIALCGTDVPETVPEAPRIRAEFDSLLAAGLRQAGFAVVPVTGAGELWNHMRDSVGGIFDPVTGSPDHAKAKALERAYVGSIAAAHATDAIVRAHFDTVAARYAGGFATWDDTRQNVESSGARFVDALLARQFSGGLPALSLHVQLSDTSGAMTYSYRGGVSALVSRSAGGFANVTTETALADRARNMTAVKLALAPLTTVGTSASARKDR